MGIDVENLPVECVHEEERPALEQMRMLAGRLLRRKAAEVWKQSVLVSVAALLLFLLASAYTCA